MMEILILIDGHDNFTRYVLTRGSEVTHQAVF